MPFGVQICSDTNRPEGSHLLGAQGAQAILIPRASEERTYQRWKIVFRANALTCGRYVLSVNRPYPEEGVLIGGPSIAIDPNGAVAASRRRTDWRLVTLESSGHAPRARVAYPGYLPMRARLYADAWEDVAEANEGRYSARVNRPSARSSDPR